MVFILYIIVTYCIFISRRNIVFYSNLFYSKGLHSPTTTCLTPHPPLQSTTLYCPNVVVSTVLVCGLQQSAH